MQHTPLSGGAYHSIELVWELWCRTLSELRRIPLPRTPLNRLYAGPLLVLLLRRCGAGSSRSLHAGLGQVLVDQPYRHGALPHSRGTPLDRAAAHVAGREDARHAGLKEGRLPRKFSPGVFVERRTVQLPARQDEAALVEVDGPSQPLGVGEQLDVPCVRDPVDEVPRHALAQVVAPYEQVDPLRASRQKQRGLARRVAPAYDRDLLAFAPPEAGHL